MFIDLDRFKLVNDTLGHVKGDELLQQVAQRLKDCLRRGDTLARQGGDEFTHRAAGSCATADAKSIAESSSRACSKPFELDGHEVHISASDRHRDLSGRRRDASTSCCATPTSRCTRSRRAARTATAFYHNGDADDESHQKIALEQSLRKALELGELEMYYQPQVDVRSGRITGAEGLMRWHHHPQRGLLSAGEFLPFAEENGLMLPLSDWMLDAVCRDLAAWNAAGHEAIKLSLNLSPQYLDRGDFFEKMRGALCATACPEPDRGRDHREHLHPQSAVRDRAAQQALPAGVAVAIDDFGTGYSSLSYLHRFPVHTIKIDQSFVKAIHDENGHYPVVLAIISIARGLGLNLVAEGVETETQARYLEQSGCRTMQGYLYHRPVPQSRLLELLGQQSTASHGRRFRLRTTVCTPDVRSDHEHSRTRRDRASETGTGTAVPAPSPAGEVKHTAAFLKYKFLAERGSADAQNASAICMRPARTSSRTTSRPCSGTARPPSRAWRTRSTTSA
jgi:predicted signal transduction protein with EAL and GGDEF domain